MRPTTTSVSGLILFALSAQLVSAEPESLLQFRWQGGKRYTMSLETSKQLVMENLPPSANKGAVNEKREFTITVLKASPKQGCELVLECLSTRFETKGDAAYSFNSSTDPAKDVGIPYAAEKRAFIGTKITYVLDAEDKVLRVDGTDELVRKMLAHDPSLKNDLSTPFLTQAKFGTNALTELLQQFTVGALPKNNTKVGEQWTNLTEQQAELTVVESKFTLAGRETHLGHDCVKIGITGDIKNGTSRGDLLPSGIPIPKVQGQIKGSLWLDTKLEMVVERTTVEETKTVFDMPKVHAKEGETMSMSMSQKKTVTVRLIKVEDN